MPKRFKRSPATAAVLTTASLNTRIHRILNAGQELKRYTIDSSLSMQLTAQDMFAYVNPVTMSQGTSLSQRIGDSIRVFQITVTAQIRPIQTASSPGSDMDYHVRNTMLRVQDNSLVSSTLAAYASTSFVNGGFISTGDLNTHEQEVVQDKKAYFMGRTNNSGVIIPFGGASLHTMTTTKKWKNGLPIVFKTGGSTGTQNDKQLISVFALNCPGYYQALVSQAIVYYSYTVLYRDA